MTLFRVVISCIISFSALGLATKGTVQYANTVWNGDTEPRIASWSAWLVASMAFSMANWREGAWISLIISVVGTLLNVIVLVAISKRRKIKTGPLDILLFVVSVTCIILTLKLGLQTANLSAILGVCANFSAALPTIVSAICHPEKEDKSTYMQTARAGFCFVAAVVITDGLSWIALAGPLAVTISNLSIFLLIVSPRRGVSLKNKKVLG